MKTSIDKATGKRKRTFETEAERAVYVYGHNDAIDSAVALLAAAEAIGGLGTEARGALRGVAIALRENGKVS